MLFSLLADCGVVLGILTAVLAIVRGTLALERELEERRERSCNRPDGTEAPHRRCDRLGSKSAAFPFRSQTVGALVEAVASAYSHAEIGTLLLKADADSWEPERYDNKEHRLQIVYKAMRTASTPEADRAARELVRMTMKKIHPPSIGRAHWPSEWNALNRALAADGWEYDIESDRLMPIVPGVAISDELNGLEAELDDLGWSTSKLHFRQAATGFAAGDWESANSQLRSFLEDFLPSVARQITGKRASDQAAAIQALDRKFLFNGKREFLKGLWALCNERGPHPGASTQAEATFRLTTVTVTARFILSRLASD